MLYSHSRLKTFESCPLKFKFQYIDKLESEQQQTIEAFLGTRVHEVLEKLYKDLKFTKENSLQDLLKFFNGIWEKNINDSIRVVRKEYNQENYRKMGVKFITDYYNRFKPFNQDKTIDVEKRVIIKLDKEGKYKLQGYIDRLSSNNGFYEIHDYKTAGNLPMEEYVIGDRQLALYSIAILKGYQDCKRVKQIWHFLAFDKDIVLEKTKKELGQLKKDTIELIKQVEKSIKKKDFQPKTSNLCSWCEFRPVCPKWKHLFETEEKEPKEFLEDDGVRIVNEFAKLKAEKDELERKIETIKESLINFSKQKGISAVRGSNVIANINFFEDVKFPGKGTEDYEKLVHVLKNLKKWDEIVCLDIFALKKIVKEESWEKEALNKLKKFEEREKTERISLRKIKEED